MSVEIEVTIRVIDNDGDPVEGIRVDLQGTWGFVGEETTDSDGEVIFRDVEGWRTLDVWIDHEKIDDIGLEGHDMEFSFTWDNPYKYYSPDDEDNE